MRMIDTLRHAAWGVTARPVRSLAVAASLAAGIAAVVVVTSIILGYGRELERMAFGAYVRSLVVSENVLVTDRFGPPRLRDLDLLRRDLPQVQAVAAWRTGQAQLVHGARRREAALFGAWGDYLVEADLPLTHGRDLTAAELRRADRVCVLGPEVAAEVCPGGSCLGQALKVNGIGCTVVGVLGVPRTRTADRFSTAVITPFLAAARYFEPGSPLGPDEVNWMTIVLADRSQVDPAIVKADLALRKAHGAPLSQPPPFHYRDTLSPAHAMEREQALKTRLLFGLAAISLAAGLLGFVAVMASSVTERRREIALRMACGAFRRDIRAQFLAESALLGLIGGVVGCVAGLILGAGAAWTWGWPFVADPRIAAIALVLGLGAGCLAGLAPARRAAREAPATAARG